MPSIKTQRKPSIAANDAKGVEQIASHEIANKESSPKGIVQLANATSGPPLSITPAKHLYLVFYIYIEKKS